MLTAPGQLSNKADTGNLKATKFLPHRPDAYRSSATIKQSRVGRHEELGGHKTSAAKTWCGAYCMSTYRYSIRLVQSEVTRRANQAVMHLHNESDPRRLTPCVRTQSVLREVCDGSVYVMLTITILLHKLVEFFEKTCKAIQPCAQTAAA